MAESVEFSAKPSRKPWLVYLGVSFFSVLSVVFIIGHSYFSTYRSLTELALHRRVALSSLAAKSMEQRLDHLLVLGKFLVSDLRFRQFVSGGDWAAAMSIHRRNLATFPFIDRILLTDPSGTLRADEPEAPAVKGKNFANRDWYRGVSRKWEPYVSEAYRRTADPPRNVVALAIPIWAQDRRVVGILVLQIRLDTFLEWGQELNAGPHAFIYFVDQKGNVLAHPKYPPQGSLVNFSTVPAIQRVLRGESGLITDKNPIDHVERVAAVTPLKGFGWGAVLAETTQSVFEIRESALRHLRYFYGVLLFFLALSGVFIVLFVKSRRRREKELQENEALYRNWLNYSTDGIWDLNMVTDELYLNPTFKKFLGYDDRALEFPCYVAITNASSWEKIVHPDDLKLALAAFKEHTENGKPFSLPLRYFHKNGSIVWALCRGVAFKDKKGRYVRMLGTLTDINELIHVKEMNRLKDEFIDTVSHELRTPLTVIKEGVSLFQDQVVGSLDAEQRGFLTAVADNVALLSGLIDTTLDLSKIEAGQLRLKKESLDLADFIPTCVADHQPLIGHRTVELHLGSVPAVFADALRVRQILSNLLSNAIKFTEDAGTIQVTLESSDGSVVLSIQDDGVGIAAGDIPKLFKKFSQVGENFSQGTGLGLALCKHLVEMHGGSIRAVSAFGKGSTFTFTLPIR